MKKQSKKIIIVSAGLSVIVIVFSQMTLQDWKPVQAELQMQQKAEATASDEPLRSNEDDSQYQYPIDSDGWPIF